MNLFSLVKVFVNAGCKQSFTPNFLNNSCRDKLKGGKFSVHNGNNREATSTVDEFCLTQYMYTLRIPHATTGMLDGYLVCLHEVDEIKLME